MQRTLRKAVEVSGIGIFTGEQVAVKICPAPEDTGLVFQRVDLVGSPDIPARLQFVQESSRCTRIGINDASVVMVEHLLSALYAYGIDNARIEVTGPEIPGSDGSAKLFVDLIEQVGLEIQRRPRRCVSIEHPLFWSWGEIHLVALPSSEFKLSYTMHYPKSPVIKSQYYSFSLNPDRYREEIASCRTFSLYEEILPFLEKGLIKGGGLENALVIQGDKILNPEGARFSDEMVRHKILDLIGDLSLIGSRLCAHVIAICSGHSANIAFAKILSEKMQPRGF
jgi:UDP-3-O-[3-hydroxymyristoyl] N-acetylglucosamine deacetylase